MNARFSLLFLLVLVIPMGAEEAPSQIRFARNNQLAGQLLSLEGDRLVWSSPVLEQPASFLLKKVLDVTLPAHMPDVQADHEAALTLMNGDVVRGQLASVTDDQVELDTWYAGRLAFRRVMVKSLRIEDSPTLLYRGPTGLDGWVMAGRQDAWSYQGNTLRSSAPGAIGRKVQTPDECRFAFTAEWRGNFIMQLNLFSEDLSTDGPQNGYRLFFQRQRVELRKGGLNMALGNIATATELTVNEKARIEIRVSRKAGVICLLIDDRMVVVWPDPEPTPNDPGEGMQFIVPQNAETLRISAIEVSSWDGHVEETPEMELNAFGGRFGGIGGRLGAMGRNFIPEPEPEPELADSEVGRMALRNGDYITGEVTSILDGNINIETATGKVTLPVARLRDIALKPAALEEPKRNSGDVRAWFPDGSSLVFRLESLTPETITGYSQTFGTADFKASAFSRIEFNVHDLPLMELREEGGW